MHMGNSARYNRWYGIAQEGDIVKTTFHSLITSYTASSLFWYSESRYSCLACRG
jgi:hypothetical protein